MLTIFLNIVSRHFARMPLERALARGRRIGWVMGTLIRFRRQEARRALRMALPELSRAEADAVLDRMYANLGMTMVELLRVHTLGRNDLEGRFTDYYREAVKAINDEGGGCLFLMGHLGNWELTAYTVHDVETPTSVVAKPIRPAAMDAFIKGVRREVGVGVIPTTHAFKPCLRALAAKENVAIVLDQNTKRTRGVFVDFFGRTACTTPGLAVLSARTGRPVRFAYVHRREDHRFDARIHAPLPPPEDQSPASIQAATQHYTRVLEAYIRAHPEQWLWIHHRWRTQPKRKTRLKAKGSAA